ncbi:MAG: hypothetical protein HY909_17730 [Deltaproteobacteria bacterium]|nr:hypothetical protein [Deltaproteobacteria bacterium]
MILKTLLALTLVVGVGCGPATGSWPSAEDDAAPSDAGGAPEGSASPDGAAEVAVDASVAADAPEDAATDEARDGSAGVTYGLCGPTAHRCVCACATRDLSCAFTCARGDEACGDCIEEALPVCCSGEYANFQRCVAAARAPSDAGPACTTNECVASRCALEVRAVNLCGQRVLTVGGDAACLGALTRCAGTARCAAPADAGPPPDAAPPGCTLMCSWGDGLLAGLSCGTSSRSCMYGYNGVGQVSSVRCTYSNGRSFSCAIQYNGLGQARGTCSGEGGSCAFQER